MRGNLEQPAGADAVDAFFVFLNLLKCQAQKIAQLFLAHADQHAPDAHAIADLSIDGIGLFFGTVRNRSVIDGGGT